MKRHPTFAPLLAVVVLPVPARAAEPITGPDAMQVLVLPTLPTASL